jgi:hypothetical protein
MPHRLFAALALTAACSRANPAYYPVADTTTTGGVDAGVVQTVAVADAAPELDAGLDAQPDLGEEAAATPMLPAGLRFTGADATAVVPANSGGGEFSAGCGAGRAVVGLEGTAGGSEINGLHSVHARCGAFMVGVAAPYAIETLPAEVLGPFGEPDGDRQRAICPAGSAVVGFEVSSGTWIDQLSVRCGGLELREVADAWEVEVEPAVELPTRLGGAKTGPPLRVECAPGTVAVGVAGAAGRAVDRMGLLCGRPGPVP